LNYRLIVLALGTFAIGTDAYVMAGILPAVARSFDVSVAAAGQFVTTYSFSFAVLAPVMATLTAHWPRRRALVAGLAVFIAGNILTVIQPTFELALASRAIAGLGAAIVTPTAGATAAALVAPERHGFAVAVVMAGLGAATALGAPIGTLVGAAGDWRLTIWFVAALGLLAAAGMLLALPAVAPPVPSRLRERLAPLADARVLATLVTTLLVGFGAFLIYTYLSVIFQGATGDDGAHLAALISIWGTAATAGMLVGGRLADRFGNRPIINLAISVLVLDFGLMPRSCGHFDTATVGLVVWGACGWGFVAAQQHRLIGIAPALSSILLGLNVSVTQLAISASGAMGALALRWLPARDLPLISMAFAAAGALGAELAYRLIAKPMRAVPSLSVR
jgi:MFS transporter, DHA1 family, inner membrane transport protein